MTTRTASAASTFRSLIALTRDLVVIGLCVTLIAGVLLDIAGGTWPAQPGAIQETSFIT